MPLYDYKCNACDHVFSLMKKIDSRNEPEKEECPECKKEEVQMQIGGANVMDSVRLFGIKPSGQFNERIAQIKHGLRKDPKSKL